MEINELFNLKDSNYPVNKLVEEENVFKHLTKRLGIFFGVLAVLFGVAAIIDDDYVMLGAIIISAGLTLILLLFLLIESFTLFSKKKNTLAKTNLIVIGISILIGGIIVLENL
ncbi:hypothetical protein [Kaistella jeonii]|uniref:Uncharacterized protein n=1 Tax=Kaistella jeonii TaxID=266749 RepID=A0A0C1FAF1_9FLAO|nr:hypothetical protein [Kaistella jeonii]KIA88893.1 hypothetical protein OA86_09620 [Kaistella jeonii]SFC12219.1 hypothetical protein SAMN05421876_1074 [Kaistella jeonii]VEI94513.1 Uncharacterised protein [Kaistella jeonii]